MTLDAADVAGLRSLLDALLTGRIPTKVEPKTPISYADLAPQMDHLLREALLVGADAIRQTQATPIGNL